MFLDIQVLERRKIVFEEEFLPGRIDFAGTDWRQLEELHAGGSAELLDRFGSRTIRVRGRLLVRMEGVCRRCLDPVVRKLEDGFELYYYPMSTIAVREEVPINSDDVDIGFYEAPGIELADVLKEQILLWLPMSALCQPDCKGLCPKCGANLNHRHCGCRDEFLDPRWEALKKLHFKN